MESRSSSLADVLERVLDKGIVVAGDIAVNVVDIELLTLRVRLFIASAQTAKELGMDWWTGDPFFAPHSARPAVDAADGGLAEENTLLRQKIAELERALGDQS